MNRIRDAWNRLASSPHRLVLSAAIGLLAVAGGIGFAVAVNGVRQTAGTAASPSTVNTVDASESEAESPLPTATLTATSTPSPTASATGSPVAAPTASPTPTATATPTPTPTPTPQPTQAPSACDGFTFSPAGAVSVDSLAELEDGIVGTWAGCATTPWVPRYWVTITFRADGTYSGFAEEGRGPAFYYGTDEDMSEKLYELNDLEDDLEGTGQIDIVFWEGNTNRGDLRNIRLMGNELEFEFFHRGEYGPLLYQLHRVAPQG